MSRVDHGNNEITHARCICWDDRKIPSCPIHGDAKAKQVDKTRKGHPLMRSKRPNQQSAHHALDEAFTDGIKAAMITMQLGELGYATCGECGEQLCETISLESVQVADGDYETALAHAMSNAAKHHVMGRTSHGYRPSKYSNRFGHSTPALIRVVCHECHTGEDSEIHPGPQFTRSEKL